LDFRRADLQRGTARNADLELLVLRDNVSCEGVGEPELSSDLRPRGYRANAVLERVAHSQCLDGDVFLVKIAVHGCDTRNLGGHVLDVVRRGHHDRPIGLPYPHVVDRDVLVHAV